MPSLNGENAIAHLKKEGLYESLFTQPKRLVASDANYQDYFGLSVAISRNTAIICAPGDYLDHREMGSAYIFERNADGSDVWREVRKIVPNDHEFGDEFGKQVAISGNTAIVSGRGSAYIFVKNSGGANMWDQVQKLGDHDDIVGDYFGFSVAISGDTGIVGAYRSGDSNSASGAAYIFEASTNPVPASVSGREKLTH